jgi:hypothetical protein
MHVNEGARATDGSEAKPLASPGCSTRVGRTEPVLPKAEVDNRKRGSG